MKSNTFAPNPKNVEINWHFIDAENKILGRLAADVASILIGKNKVEYTPNQSIGDKVVITNAEKIKVTGKKLQDKIYYKHTGFPGGLKAESLGKLLARKPEDVLKKAIEGMLPKNKLRKLRIANLYVYKGSEHPHKAQENKESK